MDFTKNKLLIFLIFTFVAVSAYDLYLYGWIQKTNLAPWLSAFFASLSVLVSGSISYSSYLTSKGSLKTAQDALNINKRNSTLTLIKDLTARINDEYKDLKKYHSENKGEIHSKVKAYYKFIRSVSVLIGEVYRENPDYYKIIYIDYISPDVVDETSTFEILSDMINYEYRYISNKHPVIMDHDNICSLQEWIQESRKYYELIFDTYISMTKITGVYVDDYEYFKDTLDQYKVLKLLFSNKSKEIDKNLNNL